MRVQFECIENKREIESNKCKPIHRDLYAKDLFDGEDRESLFVYYGSCDDRMEKPSRVQCSVVHANIQHMVTI